MEVIKENVSNKLFTSGLPVEICFTGVRYTGKNEEINAFVQKVSRKTVSSKFFVLSASETLVVKVFNDKRIN